MKRNVVFYAIDSDGQERTSKARQLARPERTKIWAKLNYWLSTEQVQKIGYFNEQ